MPKQPSKSRHASSAKAKYFSDIKDKKRKAADREVSDSDTEKPKNQQNNKNSNSSSTPPPQQPQQPFKHEHQIKKEKILKRKRAIHGRKIRNLEEEWKATPFQRKFWKGQVVDVEDVPAAVKEQRKELGIMVKGASCPPPIKGLDDKLLPKCFAQYMEELGYKTPAPVQAQCWPAVLLGRDCIIIAQAGSGKTIGYVLPAVPHVLKQPKVSLNDGPIVLVMVPTRELARQVKSTCVPLKRLFGIRAVVAYGGVDKDGQISNLKEGAEILVTTPGRLLDLLKMKATHLGRVTLCILDEADKMLEMGFGDQLHTLRMQMRHDRQTLLISATFPARVEETSRQWLDPLNTCEMRLCAHKLEVSPTITQVVHVCAEHKKPRKLLQFLEKLRAKEKSEGKRNKGLVLVFCNKIKKTTVVAACITRDGHRCAALHGKMPQPKRRQVLEEFQNGKTPILVATDVAARGIHVNNLYAVVNYDFPSSLVQYVHRVGRTGRQGATGFSFSFFTRNLSPMAQGLMRLLERNNQHIDPNLKELVTLAAGTDDAADNDSDAGDVVCLRKVDAKEMKKKQQKQVSRIAADSDLMDDDDDEEDGIDGDDEVEFVTAGDNPKYDEAVDDSDDDDFSNNKPAGIVPADYQMDDSDDDDDDNDDDDDDDDDSNGGEGAGGDDSDNGLGDSDDDNASNSDVHIDGEFIDVPTGDDSNSDAVNGDDSDNGSGDDQASKQQHNQKQQKQTQQQQKQTQQQQKQQPQKQQPQKQPQKQQVQTQQAPKPKANQKQQNDQQQQRQPAHPKKKQRMD